MLQIADKKVRALLFQGTFGLEKEGLRVTEDGRFAHSVHPFQDDVHIVRDFSENQTEINTGISTSAKGALQELETYTSIIHKTLDGLPEKEYLWPFSNPPYIENEEDIPVAVFQGEQYEKTVYRQYLSDRYGRYKMTLCGIHVNYSFSEELLEAAFAVDEETDFQTFKDQLYLHVAEGMAAYGWIVTAVTAASPVMDGSYMEKRMKGKDTFLGMASVRCGELGYWNYFAPTFDYSSVVQKSTQYQKEHVPQTDVTVQPSAAQTATQTFSPEMLAFMKQQMAQNNVSAPNPTNAGGVPF